MSLVAFEVNLRRELNLHGYSIERLGSDPYARAIYTPRRLGNYVEVHLEDRPDGVNVYIPLGFRDDKVFGVVYELPETLKQFFAYLDEHLLAIIPNFAEKSETR